MSKKRNRDPLAPNNRDEINKKHIIGYNENYYLNVDANVERLTADQYSAIHRSNFYKRYEKENLKIKENIELHQKPAIADSK